MGNERRERSLWGKGKGREREGYRKGLHLSWALKKGKKFNRKR